MPSSHTHFAPLSLLCSRKGLKILANVVYPLSDRHTKQFKQALFFIFFMSQNQKETLPSMDREMSPNTYGKDTLSWVGWRVRGWRWGGMWDPRWTKLRGSPPLFCKPERQLSQAVPIGQITSGQVGARLKQWLWWCKSFIVHIYELLLFTNTHLGEGAACTLTCIHCQISFSYVDQAFKTLPRSRKHIYSYFEM